MICWCFQDWGWWQHNAGFLKIKGLEPEHTVLKIRSNCTEISVFLEAQKSCTWNHSHAFELLGFQSLNVLQSDSLWHFVGHLGHANWTSLACFWCSQFDLFTSPDWCPLCSGATEAFLVPEARHWCSNTDSGSCVLLILFWYLPLSTFPTGQWTTKSIRSGSVSDTWRLMAGAPWSQLSRRKTREEPCLQRYNPVCHRGEMSQSYHPEG